MDIKAEINPSPLAPFTFVATRFSDISFLAVRSPLALHLSSSGPTVLERRYSSGKTRVWQLIGPMHLWNSYDVVKLSSKLNSPTPLEFNWVGPTHLMFFSTKRCHLSRYFNHVI